MSPKKATELDTVRVPGFGSPVAEPEIRTDEYQGRIHKARKRAQLRGLDFLVVYGDREHFANLAFLTGFDPRFEEALLVIPTLGDRPCLIVGTEGLGYSEIVGVDLKRQLYQGFSLLGTDRSLRPRLQVTLRDCGIEEGSRVGVAGWKYATRIESDDPSLWIEVPAFIVDDLRSIVGDANSVVNATDIFMDPSKGLRCLNSAAQIAAFEFCAVRCSEAVHRAVTSIRPGMSELQVVEKMRLDGLPLSCHLMFSTGSRAHLGLGSPTTRAIRLGDPFFVAMGMRGGLTARAGFVAAGESDLPPESVNYLEALVRPYYSAVVAWYEAVGIDVLGGDLQQAVDDALDGHDIRLALNPGHLIHLDEWVHSPVRPGSKLPFRSGMVVQSDIIPVPAEPAYHTCNAEDTLALADEELREELAQEHPDLWDRVQTRRAFMRDTLGIALKPEVLPLSNHPALVQPFALAPQLAMKVCT
jgi:hypothetical protein